MYLGLGRKELPRRITRFPKVPETWNPDGLGAAAVSSVHSVPEQSRRVIDVQTTHWEPQMAAIYQMVLHRPFETARQTGS
jgi:hypothetical protein